MKKSLVAFTLIELLVVIAIIAILAAILFPVFAQAKTAAKQSVALSNTKQMELAIIMYNTDVDDQFPEGFSASWSAGYGWGGLSLWCQKVLPYTKSIAIYQSPLDSAAGRVSPLGDFAGVGLSLAANGLYGDWQDGGFPLRGLIGFGSGPGTNGNGWIAQGSANSSSVSNPASTVVIFEKDTDDMAKWGAKYCSRSNDCNNGIGNWSNYSMGGVNGGPSFDHASNAGISQYGPELIPDGQSTYYKTYGDPNDSKEFNYGINGAVSTKASGKSSFGFVDGHAKSMVPAETDPDYTNQPQNNMWNATR